MNSLKNKPKKIHYNRIQKIKCFVIDLNKEANDLYNENYKIFSI